MLLIASLVTLIGAIIAIAFFTLVERKVMASIQRRRGPAVVGFWGVLQAFADGLKLLFKEAIVPLRANKFLFFFAPLLSLTLSLVQWAVVPLGLENFITNAKLSVLLYLAIGSLGVYAIILAGWASNSRYAFIGSIRSTAQMLSYEVCFSLLLLPMCLSANSFNFIEIVLAQQNLWNIVAYFPLFAIFLVTILAETNRAPFDLPEAEAEIVAGYNVEYSSLTFALFFLGEYGNMLINSLVTSLFFLAGWSSIIPGLNPHPFYLFLKTMFLCFFFVLVRAALPRYRYDQLLAVGWKTFMPLIFAYFIFFVSFFYVFV
jgi:NADH-quinone oxidoreductase subunit H